MEMCLFIEGAGCYEILKDFSGPLVTILIAYFGVRYAFKQIEMQHKNTIKVQKEESKRKTKIEVFKDFNVLIVSSSNTIRDVRTYCLTQKYPARDNSSEVNFDEYQKILNSFGGALSSLVLTVESHEIIHVNLFKVFRYSLQSIHHDLMQLRKEGNREILLDKVWVLANDAQNYLGDFQVCLQNMAYGDVFEGKVPVRVTVDKSLKVIVDDPKRLPELETHFRKKTAWGKSCDAAEKKAVEKYHS